MALLTPSDALGRHADRARRLIAETVLIRHEQAAAGHVASGTRYGNAFGAQGRDLLDDVDETFRAEGFDTIRVKPAGYKLPVVNNCLIFPWRVPGKADAIATFASSKTRRGCFDEPSPPDTLFDLPGADTLVASDGLGAASRADEESLVRAIDLPMPVVLVLVHSSPSRIASVEWAVATLNESGRVVLHGPEEIWTPESDPGVSAFEVESFDSGSPDLPDIALRPQEWTGDDA